MFEKVYIQAVLSELDKLGYEGDGAKIVLLCHYRVIKRMWGYEPNAINFALEVDELEKRLAVNLDPTNPNHIYIGHLRAKLKKRKRSGIGN